MRLVNKIQIWNLKYWVLIINGLVVQLDRISDFGSEGWGFEPLQGHKYKNKKREIHTKECLFHALSVLENCSDFASRNNRFNFKNKK